MEKPKSMTEEELRKAKVPKKEFDKAVQDVLKMPAMHNEAFKVGKKKKKELMYKKKGGGSANSPR